MQRYAVELWSRGGVLLADVSPFVKNFRYAMQRNEAEDLSFEIDLNSYEELCASIGTNPTAILGAYQTDVKVQRLAPDGTWSYLFGAHVGDAPTELGEIDSTIHVNASGYLNLLIDRYVSPSPFVQVDAVEIAWQLIDETQTQTNGTLGMTQGAQQATTVPRDRAYEPRQNVKEAILNLSRLIDGSFDFRFTHDREFETYSMIGTDQSATLEFVYPQNIVEVRVPRIGRGALYNKVYGLGSGFGADQLASTQGDNTSQLNYGLHERITSFNSVSEQQELDENTLAHLDLHKGLLEIPQMTVSGEDFDLSSYGIGDRITVRIEDHPYLATVNGVYRIERLEVAVDENEAELVKIYFDNYGLEDAA